MKALYELLLKVGTNPQLKAWAAKQLINLKHLKPRYKDSLQHTFDKNKVKDILDPKWLDKQNLAEKAYSLKNKVLDMAKAKAKLGHIESDKAYTIARNKWGKGLRQQSDEWAKKFGDNIDDFFKKDAAQSKWFNKTLKESLKGDKKATIEIDKYFANIEKINREKVVPFWPRKKSFKKPPGKAEGGRIGFNKGSKKGGIGDLLTELYRLSEIGPLLASPELIDLIQKIPMAEGGIAGMLGEPRSGYNEGKEAKKKASWYLWPYRRGQEWDKILEKLFKAKEIDPEDYKINVADGGRIGLDSGGTPLQQLRQAIVDDMMAKTGASEDNLQLIVKDITLDMSPDQIQASVVSNFIKHFGSYAEGGRIGFKGGGYQDYWTMVQESFSNAGGQEGTGMNIQDFAQMYFPRKAEGGRIGFGEGGKPPPFIGGGGLGKILRLLWNSKFLNKKFLDLNKKRIPSPKDLTEKTLKAGPELRTRNLLGQDKWSDIPPFLRNSLYVAGGGTGVASLLKYLKHKLGSIDKLKEDNVLQDFVDNEGVFEKAQGGRIGLAKGNGATTKKGLRLIDRQRLHFLKKLKDIYEKEWLEDWNPIDPTYHAQGGRIGYDEGGIGGWLKKKLKKKIKPYTKEGRAEYKKEWLDKKDIDMTVEEWDALPLKEKIKIKIREGNAQGGRIGLADGDTPSEAWMRDYFYSSGKDRLGVITLDDYMHGPKGLGWKDYMEHGPGKAEGGRIGAGDGYKPGDFLDFLNKEEPKIIDPLLGVDLKLLKELLDSGMDADEARIKAGGKAEGGRIGFKDGRGIMSRVGDMVDVRNVPYYGGKALQGLVNSAETLSKFPLAAGKLGSQLLQQPPKKEMFMEAIEDIAPGSWSENLGLTSLIEGMGEKRPDDAQTVGNLLGLGTEVAVPTGGAFKAGQLLLSKASKAMGKVKDGKTLEKLVDQKLTDAGQSRRDFNIMAATSGLMVALKSLGLGGLFKAATKKLDDIEIQIRGDADYEYIDEAWSGGTWANVYFKSLSKKGKKILEKLTKGKDSDLTYQDGLFVPGNSEEAAMVVQKLIAGHKPNWRLNTATTQIYNPATKSFAHPKGSVKEAYETTKTYSGKDLNKKKIMDEADDIIASEPSPYHHGVQVHDEYLDDILDQIEYKKAEGGRIGLGTGGPPIQFGIAEAEWKAKHPVQGNKISQLKDAAMNRVLPGTGLSGSLNMGNFEAFYNQPVIDPMNMFEKSGEPKYGLQYDKGGFEAGIGVMPGGEREYGLQYEKGPFSAGVGARPGGEREYRFKVRKEFNDGGLTKTIPPERGPDPQGLPSALYNGIMRPRSY